MRIAKEPAKAPKAQPKSGLDIGVGIATIAQGLATAIALFFGGWWFLEQRQTYPHAQLDQSVDVVPVAPGLVAIEVQARFENSGKTQIHLTHATVKLQNVAAEPYGYAALAAENGDAYWKAQRPVQSRYPEQFNHGELRWPVLKQFDGPVDHFVEPGETDLLVFTFLTPCRADPADPATELRRVRVASDILKPADDPGAEAEFAWKARAFADVAKACGAKGGDNAD